MIGKVAEVIGNAIMHVNTNYRMNTLKGGFYTRFHKYVPI
jgi:hypothetical protein